MTFTNNTTIYGQLISNSIMISAIITMYKVCNIKNVTFYSVTIKNSSSKYWALNSILLSYCYQIFATHRKRPPKFLTITRLHH